MVPLLQVIDIAETDDQKRHTEPPLSLERVCSLAKQQSRFGEHFAEGVYVRFEDAEWVVDRVKYRNESFSPGNMDFRRNQQTNQLSIENSNENDSVSE